VGVGHGRQTQQVHEELHLGVCVCVSTNKPRRLARKTKFSEGGPAEEIPSCATSLPLARSHCKSPEQGTYSHAIPIGGVDISGYFVTTKNVLVDDGVGNLVGKKDIDQTSFRNRDCGGIFYGIWGMGYGVHSAPMHPCHVIGRLTVRYASNPRFRL